MKFSELIKRDGVEIHDYEGEELENFSKIFEDATNGELSIGSTAVLIDERENQSNERVKFHVLVDGVLDIPMSVLESSEEDQKRFIEEFQKNAMKGLLGA